MIKFFRNIRQSLLVQGRFTRYLTYAIGEIVLVVVGILIALNINLWNSERHERKLEVHVLREIRSNLDFDLIEIEEDVALMDSIAVACAQVLAFLDSAEVPTQEFGYAVNKLRVTPHFDPNKSGYDVLVSKGVELVQNDSLRKAISALYESRYPYYARYEEERINYVGQNVEPVLMNYASNTIAPERYFLSSSVITDTDFIAMKDDQRLAKLVHAISVENMYVQLRARSVSSTIVKLSGQIDQELEHRTK